MSVYNNSHLTSCRAAKNAWTHPWVGVKLNRVRKFKGAHIVGDLLLSDGGTIDPLMLDRHPGDSTCGFPIEKPMPADFKLWYEAMHALSSQTLKLRHVLGDFIYRPHCVDKWFMNEDRSEFYYANSLNFYDI